MLLLLCAALLAAPASDKSDSFAVAHPRAILDTTEGDIEVELLEKEAPRTGPLACRGRLTSYDLGHAGGPFE